MSPQPHWVSNLAAQPGLKRTHEGYVLARDHADAIQTFVYHMDSITPTAQEQLQKLSTWEPADTQGHDYRPIKVKVTVEIVEDPRIDILLKEKP